jgi:signal peptidase II
MLGEQVPVFGNWFFLHFTENNGMAFGMELEGTAGKLLLSSFRILAIVGLGYYLHLLVKKKSTQLHQTAVALVFAGALGNILDSTFYGWMFSDSYGKIAQVFPEQGYAPFLFGKVVDMLYFPLWQGVFPTWFPIWGGESFEFFRPVFNIADTCISTGVGLMVVFQNRFFGQEKTKEPSSKESGAIQ